MKRAAMVVLALGGGGGVGRDVDCDAAEGRTAQAGACGWQRCLINDAKIVAVDVGASNGVIHVIDSVLLP